MIDLLLPSSRSQGFTRRVLKTTDHREKCKNTKGQGYDQDLKQYELEVEQINDDELHSYWGRAKRGSRKWTV